jgi:hypothetical protein
MRILLIPEGRVHPGDGLSGERVSLWRFAEGKPDYAPLSNGKELRSVQVRLRRKNGKT